MGFRTPGLTFVCPVFDLFLSKECHGWPGPGTDHTYTMNPAREFVNNHDAHVRWGEEEEGAEEEGEEEEKEEGEEIEEEEDHPVVQVGVLGVPA